MSENIRTVENATCTFCGCVCDDMILTVDLDEKRITRAKNACVLGRAWFSEHKHEERPYALIRGKEASTAEAVEEAAQILAKARFPVTYGLSDTTCEAQRQALAIADLIGSNLDTTTSVCHGPSGIAFEGIGESTMTLGEVKNRADLVIFWGGNPAASHPRLFTRYAVTPKGMYVPNGKKDRTVVLVDVRRTPSVPVADIFIQVKPRSDFEVLWALRALVKGRRVSPSIEQRTGVALATLEDLVNRMKSCQYGVLLFGMGLTMTRGRHFNSGALLALATDLNEYTHFVAKPVRGHGNVTGADNIVSWQTGFPFGVNFSRGYPRFNPGEFTTVDLLSRGEVDAALIIASDPASNFPRAAVEHLRKIPVIVLDPNPTETTQLAHVAFTTATYGINVPGTVYRMDDVPITLRPAFESPYPSDEDVLTAIKNRLRELRLARGGAYGAGATQKVAAPLPSD
ncbi:MAG: formylmethanofuran dehydrogenase subunit B [Gammaproteobacteria bacterium]|nr:formylmethanofuran dehydrogenase subunit B [Gammaproteobacteria bacterium]MCI0590305.1 formylmethanofuran dehydrogenase subunit B [Gammaproteobacteria bacterium]